MDPAVIIVPNTFRPTPGARLRPSLILHARVGGGAQASIWTLVDDAGAPSPFVLKYAKPAAAAVGAAPIEREWTVGRRLNGLGSPGFVATLEGVRTAAGAFVGFLLERIDGPTLAAALAAPGLTAAYVTAALRAVFGALDVAQGALGFLHTDLRTANVMDAGNGRFVIIDYGLATWARGPATGPDGLCVRGVDDGRDCPAPASSVAPAPGTLPAFPFPRVDVADLEASTAAYAKISPLESIHFVAWGSRGDVYHLLLDVATAIDGRCWSPTEARTVVCLLDLMQHVTGVRPAATFAAATSRGGRPARALRALRRGALRLRAWFAPGCPALLAAEALTAPLFTGRASCRVRWVG